MLTPHSGSIRIMNHPMIEKLWKGWAWFGNLPDAGVESRKSGVLATHETGL